MTKETLEEYLARGGTIKQGPVAKKPLNKWERLHRYAELHRQKYACGEEETAQILETLDVEYEFQKIMAHYIVDFYLPAYKLIIEVDGSSHLWGEQKRRDEIKDRYFGNRDFIVVRIPAESPSEDKIRAILQEHAKRKS